MPTPQVSGAVHTQQAPALSKHMLAEEARQVKENAKRPKKHHQASDELQTQPISMFSEVLFLQDSGEQGD